MSSMNVGPQEIQLPDLAPGIARDILNIGSFPILWGPNRGVTAANKVGTIPVGGKLRLLGPGVLVCPTGPGQVEDIPVASGGSVSSVVSPTVLIVGASTEQNEGSDSPPNATPPAIAYANGLGMMQWANAFSDGKLRIIKNASQGGNTSQQMLNNFRDPNHVQYCSSLDPAPGIILIGHVCGDDPGTLTPAQSAAAWLAIYNFFRRLYPSALIVACTLPGVNLPSAAVNALTRQVLNPVIWGVAQSNPSTLLFDVEGLFTDPLTGLPVTTLSGDQIHPNPRGAATLGKVLAALLAPFLPSLNFFVNDYTDDTRVSAGNGGWTTQATMPGAPGANVTATGWTFAGPAGGVRNLVARGDQFGNWQEMVYGGTAGSLSVFRATGALPAGAQIYCECELMFEGNFPVGGISDISLLRSTSQGGACNASAIGNGLGNQGPFLDPGANVVAALRTPTITIPAGGDAGGFFILQVNGAGGGTAVAGGIKVGRASQVRVA